MKRNLPALFVLSVAFLFVVVCITSCSKSSNATTAGIVPILQTTNVIVNVASNGAQSGGYITYKGDDTVTVRGICWSSTNSTPTTSDSQTTDPVVETSFTLNMTGLSANTTYYVRAFATSSAGTGYGSVVKFTTTSTTTMPTAVVTTFAGSTTAGNANGTGTGAQFNTPKGVGVDATGNFYVGDSFNNSIRKVSPAAVVTTLAGSGTLGYVDATGLNAQFYSPQATVADANGNVYVADYGNNMIRKITAAGVVTTLAGSGTPGYADGTGSGSAFKSPRGMAIDGSGNLYVADYGNNLIRKVTPAGVVTTVAGYVGGGYVDSTGTYAAFRNPCGIAIDAAGANLYVADQGNHAIRKIVIATSTVSTLAGSAVQTLTLGSPNSIVIDANNNLYFVDAGGRIMELNSKNVLYTLAGSSGTVGFANGTGSAAQFNAPQTLAIYQGALYVADSGNNQIRKLALQ